VYLLISLFSRSSNKRFRSEASVVASYVGFGQKGYHYFGEWEPPPLSSLMSPRMPLPSRLMAFEATKACHTGVTDGALLTEIVAPNLAVTDRP